MHLFKITMILSHDSMLGLAIKTIYDSISIDGLQKIRQDQLPNEASHRASKSPFPKKPQVKLQSTRYCLHCLLLFFSVITKASLPMLGNIVLP